MTVGDDVANEMRDDSLTDGWTHDSKMPGNRYIEGELASPVKANYLRVLFTANYDARFVGFTELVINDGEFVKPINDPNCSRKWWRKSRQPLHKSCRWQSIDKL